MLLYAFLIIVLIRPSWGLLNFFAGVFFILGALMSFFAYSQAAALALGELLLVVVGGTAINVAIFYGIGAIIVALRTQNEARPMSDKKLDEEMAKIRADIAARNGQPPAN